MTRLRAICTAVALVCASGQAFADTASHNASAEAFLTLAHADKLGTPVYMQVQQMFAQRFAQTQAPESKKALLETYQAKANAALDPQQTNTVELGTKWELMDKRLNVAAAVFRTTNDKQVTVDPITNASVQEGKTQVQGVELSVVGQITRLWQITAGLQGGEQLITGGAQQLQPGEVVSATLPQPSDGKPAVTAASEQIDSQSRHSDTDRTATAM